MKLKKGYVFVFIQFSLLALIFLTGPIIPENLFLLALFVFGILIGITAIMYMRIGNLHVDPEVADDSKLITKGIYKHIRHPMYLGLILITFSLVLDYVTIWRIILFILLVINQLFKLRYEEILLEKHFTEYKEYKKGTKKLFPFLY